MIEAKKKPGRTALPPERRTRQKTVWFTPAEWAKVQVAPRGWLRELVKSNPVSGFTSPMLFTAESPSGDHIAVEISQCSKIRLMMENKNGSVKTTFVGLLSRPDDV